MDTIARQNKIEIVVFLKITLISISLALVIGFSINAMAQSTVILTLDDGFASEVTPDSGSFTVTRTDDGNIAEALTVQIDIGGTALRDVDYARSGLDWPGGDAFFATIPAGQQIETVTITPYQDNLVEADETATFTLLGLGDDYIVGLDTEVSINIADDTDLVFNNSFDRPNPMLPIDIGVAESSADAVSAMIGPEGGVLSTTGPAGNSFELSIPADALPSATMITMTPISFLVPPTFAESLATSFVGGVQLEPNGLYFTQPLKLTIVPDGGVDPSLWAWAYDGNGESLHPVPFEVDGTEVSVDVWHFSGWGFSINWGEALQNFGNFAAATAEQIAILAIQNATSDPNAIDLGTMISIYLQWYTAGVRPLLVHAKTHPDLADPALSQWDRWSASIELYGINGSGALDNLIFEASSFAKQVIRAAFNAAILKCDGAGSRAEALADVTDPLNWLARGGFYGWQGDFPFIDIRQCAEVQISNATYPDRLDDAESGELEVRVGIHFKGSGGQTRYDLDPIVTLMKTNLRADPDGGFPDNEGWYTTMLTMEGTDTATVKMTANSASGTVNALPYESTDTATYTILPKTNLSLLGKPPAGSYSDTVTMEPGEQATVQATLYVDGAPSVGKTVSFALDGPGMLSLPSEVITGEGGLAIVAFDAPAEAGQSMITASHTTDTAKLLQDSITISYGAGVQVSPVAVLVNANGTVEFTATTTNLSPQKVIWSASAGTTIQSTGDLTATWTAPADAGAYTIIAKWESDPQIVGTVVATVELSGEPTGVFSEGFYYGREMNTCEYVPGDNHAGGDCEGQIAFMRPAWMRIHSDNGPTEVEFYTSGTEACGWNHFTSSFTSFCDQSYPHWIYRASYLHMTLPVGSIGSTTSLPGQSSALRLRKCYIACLSNSGYLAGWPAGVIRFGTETVTVISRSTSSVEKQQRWIFVKDDERDSFGEWALDPESLETPEEYRR